MKLTVVLLSVSVFAITACVPTAQVGGTAENPILLSNSPDSRPIRVAPGSIVYVQGRYSGQQFGITSEMTRSMLNQQALSSAAVGQVFRVRREEFRGFAPILHTNPASIGGWDIRLVRADSYLLVTRIENRIVLHEHGLELSFAIQIPSNAIPGEHQISLLVTRENNFVRFPFSVNVVQP